jgi:V/A-type H+-transporting ATPase subunit C
VDADDADEVLRILSDSDYGTLLSELENPLQFESLLAAEEDRLWRIFDELCLEDWLKTVMLARIDYANLKVLARLRLLLASEQPWPAREGTVPIGELDDALAARATTSLPSHLTAPAGVLFELEREDKLAPRQIDFALDREFFSLLRDQADRHGTSFFIEFVRVWIDLTNIGTFFRIRLYRPDADLLRMAFHDGGAVSIDRFTGALNEPWEVIPHRFFATPYDALMEHGAASLQASGSFSRLEKLLDDYLMAFVRRTRVYPFGFEPLVAYLLAKENELKMLRMILTAKTQDIPTAALKERMPVIH